MLLSSGPDYFILVDVLVNLRQPLDQAGETILTPDEAAQIRACGVEARAGQWRCPRLPKKRRRHPLGVVASRRRRRTGHAARPVAREARGHPSRFD
jgi:hypothetical protein